MKNNMGAADRFVRILIALVFVTLYFTNTVTGTGGAILLGLAAIFLLTSAIGTCPLYTLFQINTRRKKTSV